MDNLCIISQMNLAAELAFRDLSVLTIWMICFGLPCFYRSWLNRRQIDGSLNRTPLGFYDRVWQILERTRNGIMVGGKSLPQVTPPKPLIFLGGNIKHSFAEEL